MEPTKLFNVQLSKTFYTFQQIKVKSSKANPISIGNES